MGMEIHQYRAAFVVTKNSVFLSLGSGKRISSFSLRTASVAVEGRSSSMRLHLAFAYSGLYLRLFVMGIRYPPPAGERGVGRQ